MLARHILRSRSVFVATIAGSLLALLSTAAVLADTVPYPH